MFFDISNIDDSKMSFVLIRFRRYIWVWKFILTGCDFQN